MRTVGSFEKGKLLVHCGFSHIIENKTPIKDGFWLGYYLKNMSGTDPLTIHQDIYSEEISGEIYPGYNMLSSNVPSIFLNQKNEPQKFFEGLNHFDLIIFTPPAKYKNGRPDWLYRKNYKEFYLDLTKVDFPALVKARLSTDDPLATPVDMIEIKNNNDIRPLLLKEGNYRIEFQMVDQTIFSNISVK